MQHVFISYVREDSVAVDRIAKSLRRAGVRVWLDRDDIRPGERWKVVIRRAITEGTFFLACFSSEYSARKRSYMNEELTIAIEELRLRPADRTWFIPVVLSGADVPDRSIGGGETLADLQHINLGAHWRSGIRHLVGIIRGASASEPHAQFVEIVSAQPFLVSMQRAGAHLAKHPDPPPTIVDVAGNLGYRIEVVAVEPSERDDNDFTPHPGALLAQRLSFQVSLGQWDSSRLFAKLPREHTHTVYVVHRNNLRLAQRLSRVVHDLKFAPRVTVMSARKVARLSKGLDEISILEYCDVMCVFRAA